MQGLKWTCQALVKSLGFFPQKSQCLVKFMSGESIDRHIQYIAIRNNSQCNESWPGWGERGQNVKLFMIQLSCFCLFRDDQKITSKWIPAWNYDECWSDDQSMNPKMTAHAEVTLQKVRSVSNFEPQNVHTVMDK